jgi:thioester reductase-like protein
MDRRKITNWLESMLQDQLAENENFPWGTPPIPQNDTVALGICAKVLSIAGSNDDQLRLAFQDKDFALSSVGVDSIQTITLSMFIQIETVFLTGVTGYLGTYILHQLFARHEIKKVIVHVRARSLDEGTSRVIKAATTAKWWSTCFTSRLEVWTGDLAQYRLGLTETQWQIICGNGVAQEKIDAIIHSGASVRWNVEYNGLKLENVRSTLELLRAASKSTNVRFVYVSGGQLVSCDKENEPAMMAHATKYTGYAQTKLVSELLVKHASEMSSSHGRRFSILKPGYLIGTVQEGVANIDDFIWRLVASSIDIKGYEQEDADLWLYISDVRGVAEKVVGCLYGDGTEENRSVKILDGITMRQFWNILTIELGYELRSLRREDFRNKMRMSIEEKGEKHLLWPLLFMLENGESLLGIEVKPEFRGCERTTEISAAIKANIEYLIHLGYLPEPGGGKTSLREDEAFRRSHK